jgi:putative ABC transport system permease protein
METFLQDLKHSLRMFWQSRGFTAAAVAALALGIGANTAVFSVVNAVLLKPVPFPNPDRVVMFMNTSPDGTFAAASPAKFEHWKEQTSVVQDVAAYRGSVVNLTGNAFPEQLKSGEVSANYFRLFGAPVIRGRTFTAQEDLPHGDKVVVLSYAFWRRRFADDPQIIGKTISLSGNPYVVIGIIGPNFDISEFTPAPDVWTAFQLDPNTTDQGHYFAAAGRLQPGVSLAQAQARLQLSAEEYRRKFPAVMGPKAGFTVKPFREAVVGDVRPTLLILLGAVALVLLIACANVANLLLARAVGRRREMAIRAAIGAGRGRIVRQLLTESVLLSLGGAAIGLALGAGGIRALMSVNTANLPRVGENGARVGLDWRVLGFTVVVALLTGLLFGLIPALHSSRPDLSSALKESSGRSGSGFRQNKTRTILVVSEIALAIVLLVGAALLIRTSVALASVNPGFDAHHVLTMRMSLTGPRFQKSAGVEQMVRDAADHLRSLPGVVNAAGTCCIPLENGYGLPFVIMGRPLQQGPFHGNAGFLDISPSYFDVFKIPMLRGRAFTERDDGGAERVVIINQKMANQFWPKADPIGQQIWIGKGFTMAELAAETPRKIVGIAGDVHDGGLNRDPQPVTYVPDAQLPDALNALNVRINPIAWVVRTRGEPHAMSAAIQEQLRQVTGLPVSDVRSMDEVVSRSVSRQRFNMWLMTVFGGTALLLAAIGIYGLMVYSVEQRTQEIGIRLALGAETGDVRNLVVFQGMRLSLIGVLTGIGAAFGLSRVMASFLFAVKANDPLVFVTIPLLLTATALLAVWLPACRATAIDPVVALRYE